MNIIFLDIDGVLNCQTFYENRIKGGANVESPIRNICKERVKWLNELCESTKAKVVISSTWRHSGLKYCKEILQEAGATFDIIDITPDLRFKGAVRGNEIKLWIDENIEKLSGIKYYDYKSYAIIDDDSDMLLWQKENFFQTDNYSGLTPNTCYKIGRFFGKNAFE
jgi:hypothetical protein